MAKKDKKNVAPETPEVSPSAPEAEVPEAAAPAPAPAKAEKGSITVKYRDHAGVPTERVFSREVHGDNFAALADEFKASNAKACEGLN